jgi:hypothetical protein
MLCPTLTLTLTLHQVWEECCILCPPSARIIALSATMSNAEQIAQWLSAIHAPTELVASDFRPVPLRYSYADSLGIEPLFAASTSGPGGGSNVTGLSLRKRGKKWKINPDVLPERRLAIAAEKRGGGGGNGNGGGGNGGGGGGGGGGGARGGPRERGGRGGWERSQDGRDGRGGRGGRGARGAREAGGGRGGGGGGRGRWPAQEERGISTPSVAYTVRCLARKKVPPAILLPPTTHHPPLTCLLPTTHLPRTYRLPRCSLPSSSSSLAHGATQRRRRCGHTY